MYWDVLELSPVPEVDHDSKPAMLNASAKFDDVWNDNGIDAI